MWVNVAVLLKPEHIGLKFLLSTGTTVNMVPHDNESYIQITVETLQLPIEFYNTLCEKIKTYDDAITYIFTTTHRLEFIENPIRTKQYLYILNYNESDIVSITSAL